MDSPQMKRLKEAVFNLPEVEKRCLILYAELGSQRDVAKRLGVSPATVNHLISKIREEIRGYYGNTLQSDFDSGLLSSGD